MVRNYFHQLLFWSLTRLSWAHLAELVERGADVHGALPDAVLRLFPSVADAEGELVADRAVLGKLRAYLQLVQERQVSALQLPYVTRALAEWRWLTHTYAHAQRDQGEWKLTPLALLDARALR